MSILLHSRSSYYATLPPASQQFRKRSIGEVVKFNNKLQQQLSEIIDITKDFQSAGSWAWKELHSSDSFQVLFAWTKDDECNPMDWHNHNAIEIFVVTEGAISVKVLDLNGSFKEYNTDTAHDSSKCIVVEHNCFHCVIPSSNAKMIVISIPPIPEYIGAGK